MILSYHNKLYIPPIKYDSNNKSIYLYTYHKARIMCIVETYYYVMTKVYSIIINDNSKCLRLKNMYSAELSPFTIAYTMEILHTHNNKMKYHSCNNGKFVCIKYVYNINTTFKPTIEYIV